MFHKYVWVFIFICGLLTYSSVEAIEIRAIFSNKEDVRLALVQKKAVFRGDYAFTDYIYSKADQSNLNDAFFRIRHYKKTKWRQKNVVIVHKIRDVQDGDHQLLLKEECDTLQEAEQFIPINYFKRCFFSRCGLEYCLESMRIYVEEIEGLPLSIEVVAPSRQEILNLFKDLGVTELLTDSVPQWYLKEVL